MLKSLKLLKKYREIFLDVTIEEPEDFDEIGINFVNQFDEAIAELEEAMKPKSCDGCKHHIIYESCGGLVEIHSCKIYEKDETLCVRKFNWLDRYEAKGAMI